MGSYAHRISVNAEVSTFAVLDVFSQGIFSFMLLTGQSAIPAMSDEIDGFWSHGTNRQGAVRIDDDEDDLEDESRHW
ncbi:hypothetical protein KEM56_002362 [Ascosphaera pollenicola]|nr:hypothetical protein KEM56_002362 [Ascosphaera pollenicola]